MAKYSESVIEQIKQRISIVDVVSRYLSLNRKGERYWGLCPFHEEKTPSFTVVPDKGFYHCFGCGKSGSLFDFVMEMESLTFAESVRKLAQEANITLEKETPQQKKRRDELEALKLLYEKIANSFHYILKNSNAAVQARSYLKRRGFSEEITDKFLVGYAPDDPAWLYEFLRSKNYSEKLLEQSGLFSKRNKSFPLFKDRLMFPIRNWQGQVVAFGGRDLRGSSKAKYINTPETALYRKREIVYGLYEGLDVIKKSESALLCEGYFDVLALHQANISYGVAPLGTAFTNEQGKLLRRFATKLFTLFDNDAAGKAATKKALLVSEAAGFETKVITLSQGKDPAAVLEEEGATELYNSCQRSQNAFDHLVSSAIVMYNSKEATGKLQIFEEVRPYLEAVASEIVRRSYLRDLAGYLQLDEATLVRDYLNRSKTTPTARGEGHKSSATGSNNSNRLSKRSIDLYAMLTLINNRSLFPSARSRLHIDDLIDQRAVDLYTVLEDKCREGEQTSNEEILSMIEDEQLKSTVALSFQSGEFSQQAEDILSESIKRIRVRKLEKERRSVENLIRLAERENSVSIELSHLLMEKKSLDEEISQIRKSNNG